MTSAEDAFDVTLGVTPEGFISFPVVKSSGEVTFTAAEVGQVLQFVPPGGGVRTMRVIAVVSEAQNVGMALDTTFERTTNGFLEQTHTIETWDLVLQGGRAEARHTLKVEVAQGDDDLIQDGSFPTDVYTGTLSRR